jgi:predicted signal transduction protein with EAL and GGDEF domain
VPGVPICGGLASFPIDGRARSELLRKADQALYRAKVDGRNRIRLAYEEKMVPKTTHYTQTQLERLAKLAGEQGAGEAEMLREALDDLLTRYGVNDIES